jgi:hypothetical protein
LPVRVKYDVQNLRKILLDNTFSTFRLGPGSNKNTGRLPPDILYMVEVAVASFIII